MWKKKRMAINNEVKKIIKRNAHRKISFVDNTFWIWTCKYPTTKWFNTNYIFKKESIYLYYLITKTKKGRIYTKLCKKLIFFETKTKKIKINNNWTENKQQKKKK